jgi:cytochrome b involved in lipid metabolism
MSYERLTLAQFESEVAEKAQFTVIHGKVYDLSQEFLHWHPGGAVAKTQVSILQYLYSTCDVIHCDLSRSSDRPRC